MPKKQKVTVDAENGVCFGNVAPHEVTDCHCNGQFVLGIELCDESLTGTFWVPAGEYDPKTLKDLCDALKSLFSVSKVLVHLVQSDCPDDQPPIAVH